MPISGNMKNYHAANGKLLEWMYEHKMTMTEMAERLGVSIGLVSNVLNGRQYRHADGSIRERFWSLRIAMMIEEITEGELKASELSPMHPDGIDRIASDSKTTSLIDQAYSVPGLSLTQKSVLVFLASISKIDNCTISVKDISNKTGVCARAVQNAIKALSESGCIKVRANNKGDGGFKPNTYTITI